MTDDVAPSGDPQDGVRLLTFHAAKGLEWSSVFVVGLEEGLMPLGRGNSMEAEAEEQRLFYVALTRAENDLHCSWAQSRKFGRTTRSRRPSPWLAQLAIRIAENETSNVAQASKLENEARGALANMQQTAKTEERKRERKLQTIADSKTIREREEYLRHWRRGQARGADAAEEIVLPEQALLIAAATPPTTENDVAQLPGVGAIRAIHLAPRLLQALKSF